MVRFFFSSRRRHTRSLCDWSSDVCSSDLEDGRVTIARASGLGDFPACFQLVAAANPCRRGCPALDRCVCTPAERDRYLGRLSGPLLDRIDLHVELPALEGAEYAGAPPGDDSATVRARVARAP